MGRKFVGGKGISLEQEDGLALFYCTICKEITDHAVVDLEILKTYPQKQQWRCDVCQKVRMYISGSKESNLMGTWSKRKVRRSTTKFLSI